MNLQETAGNNEPVDQTELLLTFLNERDAVCPRCDYNVRNLTQPICPECGVELTLTVGAPEAPHGLFLITLAPGVFSGITLVLLALAMGWDFGYRQGSLPSSLPWELTVCLGFGLLSGIGAVLLCLNRRRFVHQRRSFQGIWALTVWAVHLAVLCIIFPF